MNGKSDATDDNKPAPSDVDPEVIRRLLHGVPLSASQTFIVHRGPQVLAHRGVLKQVEAADVAIFIADSWRDAGQTLRIQYMRRPLSAAGRLLLTYPLRDGYQLTLVDHDDATLDQLRSLSNQLLSVLEVAGITR